MSDIRPRFSLLFADPDREPEQIYSQETLDFLEPLPADESVRPLLKQILSLRTTRKDIAYRKEILEDFLQTPSLWTKCETVCRKWEGLFETAQREISPTAEMTLEQALAALKENTVSLMEHLNFLRRASQEISREVPSSGGLFAFSEYLRLHAASPWGKDLTEQIGNYPLLKPESLRAVLHLHSDDTGAVTAPDLRYLGRDDGKFLKKYPPQRDNFSTDLPKDGVPELTTRAICRLADTFRALTRTIRDAFLPLKEGLTFYHFALALTEQAEEKGFPWLFPSPIADHGPAGTDLRDLKDLGPIKDLEGPRSQKAPGPMKDSGNLRSQKAPGPIKDLEGPRSQKAPGPMKDSEDLGDSETLKDREDHPGDRGGPKGLRESSGVAVTPFSCTGRSRHIYEGEWGTQVLRILARAQIFAVAGLPVLAKDCVFCPEERVVVYDSTGKTVEQEIAALAEIFHHTEKNDIILLNHPLVTVGKAPAKEILEHLFSTFRKKGASLWLATNWFHEEFL